MWRWFRLKLLVLIAISITFVALHKRLTWEEGEIRNLKTSSKVPVLSPVKAKSSANHRVPVAHPSPVNINKGNEIDSKQLHQRVLELNFIHKMHNTNLFGEHSKTSVVIVVQVHDRPTFFEELLNSLKHVKDISNATLVISMDKFSSDMENVVSTITFCRYMVIFFPYSLQLFPHTFPGEDPNDCPRDISKRDAVKKQCNNADFPDKFGHYREVKYVQTKHHWMWKLFMVFKGIKSFKNSEGPFLFLEEDYYVLPDLIYCALKAVELKSQKCPKCTFISLGNYEAKQDYSSNKNVEIRSWISSKSNMGLVFTQSTFDIIADCSDDICTFDDYNWDWSLQAVLKKRIPAKLFTIQFKATRVYHLGKCTGMHAKKRCDLQSEVQHIKEQTRAITLFPPELHVVMDNPAISPLPKQNGGWGDLRDHTLCKSYKSLY